MKKSLIAIFVLFFISASKAQEISYGPVIGGLFYQVDNNHGTGTRFDIEDNYFTISLGGYFEYSFHERMGIKTELNFSTPKLKEFAVSSPKIIELVYLEICPSFKYNFGHKHNQGFYMLLGPRFSLVTKAKMNNVDVKNSFEAINLGLQLGVGQRIFKYIDIQAKFDYGITPFFKTASDGNKNSKWIGAYISLNFDLKKILINK